MRQLKMQKRLPTYFPLTTGEQDFSMFKYARFTAMAFLYSPIIIILLLHGSSLALFLPLTVIVLQVSLDNLLPKYTRRQTYAHAWFLDALVFIQRSEERRVGNGGRVGCVGRV